jgi:actin related protein 2/3 complex subunit 5
VCADQVANFKNRYKGMSQTTPSSKVVSPQSTGFTQMQSRTLGLSGGEGGGHTMSVLLSWHEKVVEIAGVGCIMRVMTDRRTV